MNKNFLNKYEYALWYEIFKKDEYKILDDIIKNSNIIFDIGAHIGFFSFYCIFVKNGKPNFKDFDDFFEKKCSLSLSKTIIHSFEPDYRNYKKLIKMLSNFKENIYFNNFAIYFKNSNEKLYSMEDKNMQNSFFNGNFLNNSTYYQNIKTLTLKNYINKKEIDKIDLLKMDIEGAEFDILLNLDNETLKKINTLFFEYHLLDNSFYEKYNILFDKLKKIYTTVEVIESNYNKKIGYLLAY